MRVLAFDGRTGAAGDVICGALVAAGADPSALRVVEDHLPVRYEFRDVTEQGIAGVRGVVHSEHDATDTDAPGDHSHDDGDGHAHDGGDRHTHGDGGHSHGDGDHSHGDRDERSHGDGRAHDDGCSHGDSDGHSHGDSDGHSHDHAHDDGQTGGAEGAGPARSYAAVREIVSSMDLPAGVERDALAVFETLGEAEAAVHGTELQETTFHEVGTDDAIADIVGAAALVADLDPDRIVTTPVAVGGGEVTFSHGTYPVPAPAVTEVAERTGLAVRGGPVERELLTPTGAAILGTLAESVERLPSLTVERSGYGVGAYDLDDRPNVLRATVGDYVEHEPDGSDHGESDECHAASGESSGPSHTSETDEDRLTHDEIAVLETNVDDVTPEVLGSLQETLIAAGAKDVTVLPTTMKKARPGHLVKVICDPADARRLARRLAAETGTLGVRESGARHRWIADRSFRTVQVAVDGASYDVQVKLASDGSEVYDVSAEYDDALRVARETDLPVREVLRRAERLVREE